MPDREKVIKGLEILMNGCGHIDCDDCCFYISTKPTRCGLREEQIQEDALALLKEQNSLMLALEQSNAANGFLNAEVERLNGLLKEQEAVEPKKENDGNPEPWTAWWYVCGDCGQPIDRMDRYCRGCGKQVKWDA